MVKNFASCEIRFTSHLEPIIPKEIKELEKIAICQRINQNYKEAGFNNAKLANWYERQNEKILRNSQKLAGDFYFKAGECFMLCSQNDIPGPNWHELASLQFLKSVESHLKYEEDLFFHKKAFHLMIRELQQLPKEGRLMFNRVLEAEKMSQHLIQIHYKRIIKKLEEKNMINECDLLTKEYYEWTANNSTSLIRKILYWFWGLTSGYGTNVVRWIFSCIMVIASYAAIYYFSNLETEVHLIGIDKLIERIYFSVVTFTTLGFGDILPKHCFGMCTVITEVILGNLMFFVMITILGKKIFRKL
ncbi:MAG: potassium channel family protein [bacterium]